MNDITDEAYTPVFPGTNIKKMLEHVIGKQSANSVERSTLLLVLELLEKTAPDLIVEPLFEG